MACGAKRWRWGRSVPQEATAGGGARARRRIADVTTSPSPRSRKVASERERLYFRARRERAPGRNGCRGAPTRDEARGLGKVHQRRRLSRGPDRDICEPLGDCRDGFGSGAEEGDDVSEEKGAMRFYVVTVYGKPEGPEEEWFTACREREGAPEGTYGCSGPTLGYTVIGVPECYTGPYGRMQSWVYPTLAAALKEARSRRKHALSLAKGRASRKKAGKKKGRGK